MDQSVATAAAGMAVGGFLFFIGNKLFGNGANQSGKEEPAAVNFFDDDEDEKPTSSKKPKKSKKGKKTAKKKTVLSKEVEEPVAAAPVAAAPVAPAAPAPAAPSAASKKKKGKKKAAVVEKEPEPVLPVSKNQKKKKSKSTKKAAEAALAAEEKAAKEAALAAATAAALSAAKDVDFDESEWSTVKTKTKRKLFTPSNADASVSTDSSTGVSSITLDIGDFGSSIIGPAGSRINIIQETSGASVNIDKATKKCSIKGTTAQVDNAKQQIIDIIGTQKKEIVDVGAKRGLLFGVGGETIRKIQNDTGARLDLVKGSSVCTISGKDSAVDLAKAMIMQMLDSTNVEDVSLDANDRAAIIGKGGENIRRLQQESGATLDIKEGACAISGTPSQVAKAKELIKLYLVHRGPPPESAETLNMPIAHGRVVIGSKGAVVNALQSSTGTRINISHIDGERSQVAISGDTANVANCVAAIKKLIVDNSHVDTLPLASVNLVKAVIGEKGATIKGVRESSDAQIEIAADSQSLSITGTKAQVAKAKAMLEKVIADELGPPPVPKGQTQHAVDLGGATGKIIGSQGSNIARLEKEHNVSITVKSGTMCYVTGNQSDVDTVKKEIQDVLERHQEMLMKARKQQEELAKVQAQSGVSAENYAGWDVPDLDRHWATRTAGASSSSTNGVAGWASNANATTANGTANAAGAW